MAGIQSLFADKEPSKESNSIFTLETDSGIVTSPNFTSENDELSTSYVLYHK